MRMKNVTVSLAENVAHWARVRAAERDMSLSRFLGRLLEERMQHEESYDVRMRRYCARQPRPLRQGDEPYPPRGGTP